VKSQTAWKRKVSAKEDRNAIISLNTINFPIRISIMVEERKPIHFPVEAKGSTFHSIPLNIKVQEQRYSPDKKPKVHKFTDI